MSLPFTPATMAAVYDFLVETPPFNRWSLPDSEEIVFLVTRSRKTTGYYSLHNGRHYIGASRYLIGHTNTLVELVGHEMVHLHQKVACMESKGVEHNAAFFKLSAQVCKVHGWDWKAF